MHDFRLDRPRVSFLSYWEQAFLTSLLFLRSEEMLPELMVLVVNVAHVLA